MSSSTEMIDHVVMFNISDEADPVKVNAWVEGLNSLASLSEVIYLTAGPILRPRTFPDDLQFTHLLHSRYPSLPHLHSYSAHPDHVRVVTELGLPITTDLIALDWAWPVGPKTPLPGRACRFTFFKIKDGAGDDKKHALLDGLRRIKESCDATFEEMTYGEEVSIGRAKGFSVAAVAVFPNLNELDACEDYEDSIRSLIDKLKGAGDGVISVDYVVPRSGPTTTSTTV